MQTATGYQSESTIQARPAAIARPKTARLAYLDSLRAILIILVIALHTAITYGAQGDWTYTDPAQSEISGILLTLVTGIVQAFSLGLYFFVSGYFTPGSYDRKGALRFWKDRLVRLGIPMVLYTFVFSLVTQYAAAAGKGEETRSFGAYFAERFLHSADEGPTWFIFALLMFCVGYTLWRLATRSTTPEKLSWTSQLPVPGKKEILGFGVCIGALMFVIGQVFSVNDTWEVFGIFNLMVIFFAQYIPFFIAGMLAYRNDWLAKFDGKSRRFWGWLALGLILIMPVIFVAGGAASGEGDKFMGGMYWQSAAFMLWVGLLSVSISMALILWLRDGKLAQSKLMTFAGPNSYAVYLIHPMVLVPVAVALSGLALFPLLKFAIVLPLVVTLCFLIAEALRRIPGVKSVL